MGMQHLADHQPVDAEEQPGDHAASGPCFTCWCYSCGGRTDQPRVERADDRHRGDGSHRWCFV